MGFLDRAKEKAEELAKQAKPAAERAKVKATPMAEKMRDRTGKAAQSLKDSAVGFRDGLNGDDKPPTVPDAQPPAPKA